MWPLPGELIENFHFLRPMLLLGLIPALVFFLLLHFLQSSQSNWSRAIDPKLLPYLLDKTLSAKQSYPLYGLLLVWILGILAVAGPVWKQIPVPVQAREDAVVIVADLSLSMYATDLRPDRATRLRRKILDILEFRRKEGQTGLIVYAGDAHTVTPMTDDVETISNLVSSLQPSIMPSAGSDPVKGVALAVSLLGNSNLSKAKILLLTDGIQNTDIPAIMTELAGSGHTLSVLGFGTEAGAPIPNGQQGYLRDDNNAIVIPRLDRIPLQQLAVRAGGHYADAQLTDEDITYLLQENLINENENLVDVADREFDSWYEMGPWLLLLVLPFAALAFRRGWLLVLLLCIGITPAKPVYAWEWQDLWQRKDQQGENAFTQEDFADAAQKFKDPNWRAAANYRSENYEAVIQDLALQNDPESNYNRGNALAKLGMFKEALDAYDRTLAQVPDHSDALQNRELVAKLLDEQEQEEKEKQNSEGDQQQQDQQQQDQDQKDQQQQDQQQQNQDQQNQDQQQQQQDQEQKEQEENANKDQQEQDKKDSDKEQEQKDQEQQEQEASESDKPPTEEEQAMQQWLMRIPDDPGELLRNKFRYQTQQQLFQQLQNPALSEQETNKPKW